MLALFVAFLCINSALAAGDGGNCVSPNINFEEKLRIHADANDHDNNSLITTSDIAWDLKYNYDTNGDGEVTEEEWIAQWSCAYGDTDYFARFSFVLIGLGRTVLTADRFIGPPWDVGIPRDTFIARNRQRYALFAQYGCVNTDLTTEQKLDINLAQNNHNNDSVVDSSDIAYDLNTNYDYNNDSKIVRSEWIERWCCAYGDTAAYARYVWDQIAQGADFIQASQFNGPPLNAGLPLAAFKENNRKRYETYAAQHQVGK